MASFPLHWVQYARPKKGHFSWRHSVLRAKKLWAIQLNKYWTRILVDKFFFWHPNTSSNIFFPAKSICREREKYFSPPDDFPTAWWAKPHRLQNRCLHTFHVSLVFGVDTAEPKTQCQQDARYYAWLVWADLLLINMMSLYLAEGGCFQPFWSFLAFLTPISN